MEMSTSKDKKWHFFQTPLHTLHWPSMKSSSSFLVVASLVILLPLLECRRQLSQFKNILWPQKKKKKGLYCCIVYPFFVFPLSWLWSFFPGADFYSQILEIFFFFNNNRCFAFAVNPLPSTGCHASSWMVSWLFSPRYQAPQDKLPLKNLILIQPF